MRVRAISLVLSTCVACNSGSDQIAQAASASGSPSVVAFTDAYRLDATLTLPDTGRGAIVSVHSLDVGNDGRMLLADSRNHDVAVLDSTGHTTTILGRAGSGPGEFRQPVDARFLPSGGVVVADVELARISVFGPDLVFARSFSIADQSPRALTVVDDSTFVISGLVGVGHTNHTLASYRLDGGRVRSFLVADSLVFTTNMIVDGTWLTTDGRHLFAGLAILPIINRLTLGGDSLTTTVDIPPEWKQLKPQEHPSLDFAVLRRWLGSATLSGPAFASPDGSILLSMQRTNPDSTIYSLGLYSPDLALRRMYTRVPGRPVGVHAGSVYLLTDADDGRSHLSRYRPIDAHSAN